jgi:hypothetical protein
VGSIRASGADIEPNRVLFARIRWLVRGATPDSELEEFVGRGLVGAVECVCEPGRVETFMAVPLEHLD